MEIGGRMSYDATEEKVEKKPEPKVKKFVIFAGFLKRSNRLKLCGLSEKAYGSKYEWQRMLKKGYLARTVITTSNGKSIPGKKVEYPSLREVYQHMLDKIVGDIKLKEQEKEKKFGKANINRVV